MVINAIQTPINLTPARIAQLANRHTGIGFDQCLIIECSEDPSIDFVYRIFNADGREVGQCGNGARCLARFVRQYGLTTKSSITVATKTTRMTLVINKDDTVTVDMGQPRFAPDSIPLATKQQQDQYSLTIDGHDYTFHVINVGNPHAVLIVDDITTARVQSVGSLLCTHPFFPEQCNIEFMQRVNANHIQLRVYERGAGETNACGSGAVAAAAVGMLYYELEDTVTVTLLGGTLDVHWDKQQNAIYLTGPATFVYEGVTLD